MADLTPNNREEFWLQGMVDGQTDLTPNKRREYWYKEIVDAIGSGGGGGTGGGVLVAKVNVEGSTGTLDKTWSEMRDADFCIIVADYGEEGKDYFTIISIYVDNGYKIDTLAQINVMATFTAVSANDYPVASLE